MLYEGRVSDAVAVIGPPVFCGLVLVALRALVGLPSRVSALDIKFGV